MNDFQPFFIPPPNNKEEYAWDTSTADQQASIKLMKKKKKKKNKKIQSVPRVSKKKKTPKKAIHQANVWHRQQITIKKLKKDFLIHEAADGQPTARWKVIRFSLKHTRT